MALFTRVHTWVSNEILTAAALNAEFDNILANAQISSMIGTSQNLGAMQTTASPGGLGTEQLAPNGSVEVQQLRYMAKLFSGQAQWYIAPPRTLAAGGLAVQTADLADASVTPAKLAALNKITSASSGNYTTTSTAITPVTNLSCTITTSGRPVRLEVIPGTTGTGVYGINGAIFISSASAIAANTLFSIGVELYFYSGGTNLGTFNFNHNGCNGGISSSQQLTIPCSVLGMTDSPAAGTYTYTVQVACQNINTTTSFSMYGAKLVAREID